MKTSQAPLVEPIAVRDTFVSGMASVEPVGPDLYRLTFYAEGHCAFDGREERAVVARFIIAGTTIRHSITFVLKEMARRVFAPANS
jgi:hypothetical protein